MTPAEIFISRLNGVKTLPAGPWAGRWLACCPAHDDKTPSLNIAEHPDSRLLIHCYAGCAPLDIVESVGLDLKDLFPFEGSFKPIFKNKRRTFDDDQFFLAVCSGARARGERLSQLDMQKERAAFLRVQARA